MSNALINYHIRDGEPVGSEATLEEISDYYGTKLEALRELKRLWEAGDENEIKFQEIMKGL